MQEKPKFPKAVAARAAGEILAALMPSCARIVVAGSLRRDKPFVGDIELLYVPVTEIRQDPSDMFARITVNLADEKIVALEKAGTLERRLNVNGYETYGPKNKLMRHVQSGIPVDLFSTSSENWYVSLVIRTGSKETNIRLTTGAQKIGRKLHAYGSGITESDGTAIKAASERDVFALCNVAYLEPHAR